MADIHRLEIPEKVDLTTGEITTRQKRVFRMTIFFSSSKIRRG
jgi:adenylate kinase